jgi:catecholate siderophore receptor
MRGVVGSVTLAVMLATPGIAFAGDSAAEDGDTIIVTGRSEGYRAIETTSGTKTAVPILDVPQSISVVTEKQIADLAIRSIADLVRYVPGVSSGQGEGHRDQITLRGNNSTADFFVDGLRDDVQYFRGFYNIDRVEIHKGPNAMIFGRGGGGGILNRVTKGALIDDTSGSVTASIDSFGSAYAAADANVALGRAALRLNAFYESLDNHRDAFGGTRLGINPTVGAQLGDRFKVQLSYEYARDDRVVDRGIPSAFAGTLAAPSGPVASFRNAFIGVRGVNEASFDAHMVRLRTEAKLTDTLTLSTQALYGDYDKAYTNVFAATAATPGANGSTIGVEAYRDTTQRTSFIAQSNLEWRVTTGPIDHVFLIGSEYTRQKTTNERINGFFDPLALTAASRRRTVALADPIAIPPVAFVRGPLGNSNRAVATRLEQTSFYLQDQIGLGDRVDLIAGLRYDRFDLGFTNSFTAQTFSRADDLWSPRIGLVFKPVPQASMYVSYSKSFLPQSGDQFLSLDLTTAALEPEVFDNYEIGAKWDIRPGLSLTAAVYRLDRSNTRAAGPVAGSVLLTGQQRTTGVEIGLTGRITPQWQTSIGYGYTDSEITQTTSAAPAGRRVAQVPRHQLSLWNRYDLTKRVGLGVGLYHQSRQFTTISNVTELPAYTRVDAALFVKLADRIEAQLNVENLTDATYFPVAHNDNNISTGAPVNARLTVAVKF